MTNPFDYIKVINKKEDPDGISQQCNEDKGYSQFIINRFYSFFKDTIFFANEVNARSQQLNSQMHFDFYYHLLGKKQRFQKWVRKQAEDKSRQDDIEMLQKYYGCSSKEAARMLPLLNQKQKQQIESEVFTGGTKQSK
jgi:hypothetical protein